MKSIRLNINLSKKLKIAFVIITITFTVQGCFFGEDQMPPEEHVCAGVSNRMVTDATQSQCSEAGGEWFEGEGCYCHGN